MELPIDRVTLPANSGDRLEVINESNPGVPLKSWRYVTGGLGNVGRWYFDSSMSNPNPPSGTEGYVFERGNAIDPNTKPQVIDPVTGNVVTPVEHNLDVSLLPEITNRPPTP